VLYFKAAADIDQLVFSGEIGTIRAQAKASSYGDLQEIISAADRTEDRLRANVNFELAMELLLFEMREHCRA
jgi:DNA polymerase-3 subunit delta'